MKSKLTSFMTKTGHFFKKYPKAWHILIILTYLLCTFYYMTPQVLHCNTTVYGFGDNTAGPIWRYKANPSNPLGGFEKVSNYPFGENVYTPASFSASIQYTAYWGLAKIAGPICGYNIVNFTGFVLSAVIMYGLVYALTKRRAIAWLAGFAASFSPYYQVKAGNHMGYGYQALLVGIIWAFFNLIKYKKKRYAIILGGLLASCFYFDPYFSLLAVTCLGAVGSTWLLLSGWRIRQGSLKKVALFQQLRLLVIATLVTVLLLAPLLFIAVSKSKEINSTVSASRGNVLLEARACSLLPHQYAAPFVLNPVFTKLFGNKYYKTAVDNANNHFPCGIGEGSIGISLTMMALVGATLVIFGWERLNKRRLRLGGILEADPMFVLVGVLAIGLFGVIMALPPEKLGSIPTPSYVLLALTSTWRTLARFYVLVNISVVLLFSISLAYFARQFKQHKKLLTIAFVILFFMIFIEYQAFKPLAGNTLSNFNYNKDVPSAYVWLGQQKDVQAVAEYPLERAGGESDAVSYYFSMQLAHNKPLFNSAVSTSPQENTRSSLKDLSDPQTVPVLEKLGVDTVVIHGVPAAEVAKIPHLKVVYSSPQSSYNILAHTPTVKNDTIVIAKLEKTTPAQTMLQLRKGDFPRNGLIIISAIDWQYEALQNSYIDINPVVAGSDSYQINATPVCFAVRMSVPSETDQLTLLADGKPVTSLRINGVYQNVRTSATKSLQLRNRNGSNMQIKDLGCPA